MFLYHFLITAQFSGMITTYALMPIRSIILVKCIRSQVQYPIIQCLILQNSLIRFRRPEAFRSNRLRYKLCIIQIAFVYIPHFHQAEQQQYTNSQL